MKKYMLLVFVGLMSLSLSTLEASCKEFGEECKHFGDCCENLFCLKGFCVIPI